MTNRYGNMKNGADDIKHCKFFTPTNWASISAQTVRVYNYYTSTNMNE